MHARLNSTRPTLRLFFFQAEDGIRDLTVTGVQTCALPICRLTRIRESLPTINYLREHGAKTILVSHFGRPKGKRVQKYSLRPIGDYLQSLIHQPVIFSHDTID